MQNMTNQQTGIKNQIKSGKYEFYVQGVITKDSNGYELKTQKGNTYKKLRIIIIDKDETHTIYHLIFGSENIKEIVYAIANPALTHVYKMQGKDFELETLIGEGGWLLLGKQFNNGNTYPKIECFLKPKVESNEPFIAGNNESIKTIPSQNINYNQSPRDNDVPF